MRWGWGWRPYVSVATRRANARREMSKLRQQGVTIQPVEIAGRKIARTFWGEAWCKHLESFSDYENRLPRGRTYVRNGSVCHLGIADGTVKAIVSGSELYDVEITIGKLSEKKWKSVVESCSGQIGSLLELLQGKLSKGVMSIVTDRNRGLFPLPKEIELNCSCPDWAVMCKHVAAVLYGVGARLDEQPELLFVLRGVDHLKLIEADAAAATVATGGSRGGRRRIAESDLEGVFGIEMLQEESPDNNGRKGNPGRKLSGKRAPRRYSNGADSDMVTNHQKKSAGRTTAHTAGKTRTAENDRTVKKRAITTTHRKDMDSRKRKSTGTGRISNTASTSNGQALTGKTVRELRARLDMSQNQLAKLIGVSAASVCNWEKRRGRLNLQQRTIIALSDATKLSKRKAWNRIG